MGRRQDTRALSTPRAIERQARIAWCILLAAASACAGPFEEGVKAYDEGKFASALTIWLPLAEQGLVAAQMNLGVLYEKAQGVSQDYAEAARWYLKAAEQGHAEAQLNVAMLYEQGIGLPLDPAEARRWYNTVLASPLKDRATLDMKQHAREGLFRLPPRAGEAEEVVAYKGGRFLLRRAPSGDCVVAMQGSVTSDSGSRFNDVVRKAAANRCSKPLVLVLESPGGLLFDGIELGEQVRAQGLHTVARYGCASACSLIFLGGVERVLWGSRAAIGLHQPRQANLGCDNFGTGIGTYKMKGYLRDVIPANADRIFEIILNTPCNSMEWIYGNGAIGLGIATKLEAQGIDVFGPEKSRRWTK